VAKNDGAESGLALPQRKILLASDAKKEVGSVRRNIVKHVGLAIPGMSHCITSKMESLGL
jgi:hypothetical protein